MVLHHPLIIDLHEQESCELYRICAIMMISVHQIAQKFNKKITQKWIFAKISLPRYCSLLEPHYQFYSGKNITVVNDLL